MDEIIERVNYYVKLLYNGDTEEIRKNYDFLDLYLKRYKNLKIEKHGLKDGEGCIFLHNDDPENDIHGMIVVKENGVGVSFEKDLINIENEEIVTVDVEFLALSKNYFMGSFLDWAYDDSGIEYKGNDKKPYNNIGARVKTFFDSDGILKPAGEGYEVIKKFNNYTNIKKYNEVSKYHIKEYYKTCDDFSVGEYDVESINVYNDIKNDYNKLSKLLHNISYDKDTDYAKELAEIDNGTIMDNAYLTSSEDIKTSKTRLEMLHDKILSLYMITCNNENLDEEDYVVNHIDLVKYVIEFVNDQLDGKICDFAEEEYNKEDNSYKISIKYNNQDRGYIIISPDGIGMKVYVVDDQTSLGIDNNLVIVNDKFDGYLSSLFKITSDAGINIVVSSTGFNNNGIVDGETTVPYENTELEDIFEEIKLFHKELCDELLEYSKPMNLKMHVYQHNIDLNVNPEDILLKDGKVCIKRKGK